MTERPILFNPEMVRSILEGRKSVTRRVIKPQSMLDDQGQLPEENITKAMWAKVKKEMPEAFGATFFCPHGRAGDKLWIRETFSKDCKDFYPHIPIVYRASDGVLYDNAAEDCRSQFESDQIWKKEHSPVEGCCCHFRWRPSIHIKREDSRIDLEILKVSVERVQEISEEDVIKEGLRAYYCKSCGYTKWDCQHLMDHHLCSENDPPSSIERFEWLWDSINKKRGFSWESNPWTWRIEFRRIQ